MLKIRLILTNNTWVIIMTKKKNSKPITVSRMQTVFKLCMYGAFVSLILYGLQSVDSASCNISDTGTIALFVVWLVSVLSLLICIVAICIELFSEDGL